jgi:cellulose synthase/poly-beta-1,6-N-acetylglucosamine synthase-like glycosyltransferase
MPELSRLGFWVCFGALVYVYAGFGLLVAAWAVLRPRRVGQAAITPPVSLIVAAYNEVRSIAAKLDNALELDYPAGALEIIVASDGSDDGTDVIVGRYAEHGVQLLPLPRRGKGHALHEAVSRARGEVLVFSDANTVFHRQALRMLVRNFADPGVGGVCGNQVHCGAGQRDSSDEGERLYWSYDKRLKALESLTGSIVSADGAIYAVRRHLYRRPESAAVTDDFAISTAVIEQGCRLVYESEALAYEPAVGVARAEFDRKVRIITRGVRGVLLRRSLLNPFHYGFYSVILLSHKVLRRLAPVFLIGLLASSLVAGANGGCYLVAAAWQAGFYGLAAIGGLLRGTPFGRRKLLCAPFFYCLANAAALVALVRILSGKRIERWQPQRSVTPT